MKEYELYHTSKRKHKYIKKIGKRYFYTQEEIKAYLEGKKPKSDLTFEKTDYGDGVKDYRLDFNKENISVTDGNGKKRKHTISDGVGVRVDKKNKSVELYNTTNKKFYKNDERLIRKSKGRVSTEYAEDGVSRKIDFSKDKRNIKQDDERYKRLEKEWGIGHDTPKEYRQKRRKKVAKQISNNAKKTAKSMKKQVDKGKKVASKLRPKIGHSTTIKTGGSSATHTYTDSKGNVTKTSNTNNRAGHNTKVKTRQVK